MEFAAKTWEDVDWWIRKMGTEFSPFADELSRWRYNGEDILDLSRKDFFDGFRNLSETALKLELWNRIQNEESLKSIHRN